MAAATRVMPGMASVAKQQQRLTATGLVVSRGRGVRRHGLERDTGTRESNWCSGSVARAAVFSSHSYSRSRVSPLLSEIMFAENSESPFIEGYNHIFILQP
ncbi:hypothetical protein NL676_012355 [Syzygium grande]|nr:hypothetical protein NL676_012355 [Syzygium grande]